MSQKRIAVLTVLLFISVSFLFGGQKKAAPTPAPKSTIDEINIPFTKYTLSNGLTLIVHEDHKAPIVAVNIWYHVGSKNEKPGRTGFAHLFEHLMFSGSEHCDEVYIKEMEKIGATDLNGTTEQDRTNYFENVPTSALDRTLWMESDRMGHLLGVLDQKKLDLQRGVVQNEKRQGENQPYAVADELITKSTYPAGHPYSWTVIGSMDDLNAASLDDVKEWFRTYYGPGNAVLVVAGDIDTKTAYEKVQRYFGDLPAGPPVGKYNEWIAKRTGTIRQQVQDRVPQARVSIVWNVPRRGTADADYLRLAASVLSSGKTSRLYKRLVYDDQIATDVFAYVDQHEIGSQFNIVATAKPGGDISKVEKEIDEELAKFLKSGPTEKELKRAVTQFTSGTIRALERIGGFGGKADLLAQNEIYQGDPAYFKVTLSRMGAATPKDLLTAANTWLSDGKYVLDVLPFGEYTAAPADTAVRNSKPGVSEVPDAKFPTLEHATLDNGMKILLASRTSVPVISIKMLFDAGFAADRTSLAGTANLAMSMLDEGTPKRTALQISEDLGVLGAHMYSWAALDICGFELNTLKSTLDPALDIYADALLHPTFPQADFDRLKKEALANIEQEKVEPVSMGLRVLPRYLYGEGHAYSCPMTGSGTEESVNKMTRDDMVRFHQTWLKPNNATLIIVGDVAMNEIKPKLEQLFKDWKPGDVPSKNLTTVELSKPAVYLVDRPGSQTSIILAGHVTIPKNNPDEIAIDAMNTILGGSFGSRINMNLREDKHWSYGSGSAIIPAKGQRPFFAYGIVQTDKTKESMVELNKELREIRTIRPVTSDELSRTQANLTLQLPGRWETIYAVSSSIQELVEFGMPEDFYGTYSQKIRSLNLDEMNTMAKKIVQPDNAVWVVVGDASKIRKGIEELNYGGIHLIDSDGKPLESSH